MDYTEKNSRYLANNPRWHSEDAAWKAAHILRMVQRNDIKFRTVGEIGCGSGEILSQLHNSMNDGGINFYGYDVSPDAFKIAFAKEKDRLKFFCADLLQLEIVFDLLLVIDVMEHVDDYMGFIRKSAKRAKYKIFHVPLDISVYSILKDYQLKSRADVGHLHYFTKDTALATLRDCGMEIVDFFYTPSAFELRVDELTTRGKAYNLIRKMLCMKSYDLSAKMLGGFSLMVLTK